MSGINEFNNIQPEEMDVMGPDINTGKKLLITTLLTAIIITCIAAAGYVIR